MRHEAQTEIDPITVMQEAQLGGTHSTPEIIDSPELPPFGHDDFVDTEPSPDSRSVEEATASVRHSFERLKEGSSIPDASPAETTQTPTMRLVGSSHDDPYEHPLEIMGKMLFPKSMERMYERLDKWNLRMGTKLNNFLHQRKK